MKRYGRGLAKFLALVLMLSCLLQPGMAAHASVSDTDSKSGSRQEQTPASRVRTASGSNVLSEEMPEDLEPEDLEDGGEADSQPKQDPEGEEEAGSQLEQDTEEEEEADSQLEQDLEEADDQPEQSEKDPVKTASGSNVPSEKEPEDIPEDLSGQTGITGSVETATPSDAQLGIAPNSLLPQIKEENVYLDLRNCTQEELKKMPWKTVLRGLYESAPDDNVEIDSDSNVVLEYFENKDEYIREVNQKIDRSGTVDLTQIEVEDTDTWFKMVLLVGSGNQLDYNATRYIVTVNISPKVGTWLDYLTFYLTDGAATSTSTGNITGEASLLYMESSESEIPETIVACYYSQHSGESEYNLGISSKFIDSQEVEIQVYQMNDIKGKIKNAEITTYA